MIQWWDGRELKNQLPWGSYYSAEVLLKHEEGGHHLSGRVSSSGPGKLCDLVGREARAGLARAGGLYARFWEQTREKENDNAGERIGEDMEGRALVAEVEKGARKALVD